MKNFSTNENLKDLRRSIINIGPNHLVYQTDSLKNKLKNNIIII